MDGPVDAGRRAPARGEPAWDVDAGDRRDSEPDWEGREMSDPSLSGCCSNMSQRISPPSHGQWFVLLVWPSLQDFRKLNKMYDMCELPGLTRRPDRDCCSHAAGAAGAGDSRGRKRVPAGRRYQS